MSAKTYLNNTEFGVGSIVLNFELEGITNPCMGGIYAVSVDITILPQDKLADLSDLRATLMGHTVGTLEEITSAMYRDCKAFYNGKGFAAKVECIVTAKAFCGYNFVRVHVAG